MQHCHGQGSIAKTGDGRRILRATSSQRSRVSKTPIASSVESRIGRTTTSDRAIAVSIICEAPAARSMIVSPKPARPYATAFSREFATVTMEIASEIRPDPDQIPKGS